MPNRALRILIADDQHFHRMQIERTLNQLSYYRVAPVHRLEELLTLVEYACDPFDLLIINGGLATHSGFDLLAFCLDNPQIDHALIYGNQRFPEIPSSRRHKVQCSRAESLDSEAVKRLMLFIDPPQFKAPRPGIQWLPDLPQGNWSASAS
ncbi:response regulator [Pseudomonas sp. Fl5BN2]|uniref:response regulator n=1 Tax=unclassified Pseudomonas TaxID=196821 RepID=UPI0013769F53|nr:MULTISPECIES: response regulator [unclassified Pseudomonas]NBF05852.1 response regulator [Pseudomonas sp. Fl5BN2]NBF11421.1 response regulator [Pseudomonas sp. Fl4BN1]